MYFLCSNRERKQREIYLESMKKEAEQKKLQAERVDRRLVSYNYCFMIFVVVVVFMAKHKKNMKTIKSMFFFLLSI